MKKRDFKKKRWDSYNLNYALDHQKINPEEYFEFKEVLKLYNPKSEDSIIEIGCNTGEFCYLLKKKFNVNPLGVDINKDAIKIALDNYPDIDFQVKDIFEVEGKYDVIYMQHVIEHIKEPENALIKLKEILKPNGKIIISCPNNWAYSTKLICLIYKKEFFYDPSHVSEFDPVSLSDIIKKSGLKKIKITTKPLGIPFIYRFLPNLQYSLPAYLFGDIIFVLAQND